MIFILILIASSLNAQSNQDSIKLKHGSKTVKAVYIEKINGKLISYKTMYLDQNTNRLFVISKNKRKKRFERRLLPKKIEIQ